MQHTNNRGGLNKRSYFIRKQFQFTMRYNIQVIQEVIPQDNNPQRTKLPRMWTTQGNDNRQGSGRDLFKQKNRQFIRMGTGKVDTMHLA